MKRQVSNIYSDMVGGDKVVKGRGIYITCKGEKLLASTMYGLDEQ